MEQQLMSANDTAAAAEAMGADVDPGVVVDGVDMAKDTSADAMHDVRRRATSFELLDAASVAASVALGVADDAADAGATAGTLLAAHLMEPDASIMATGTAEAPLMVDDHEDEDELKTRSLSLLEGMDSMTAPKDLTPQNLSSTTEHVTANEPPPAHLMVLDAVNSPPTEPATNDVAVNEGGGETENAVAATPAVAAPAASSHIQALLEQHSSELMQWLLDCREANSGAAASLDDVLYYCQTKFPECLGTAASQLELFQWVVQFSSLPAVQEVLTTTDVPDHRKAQALLFVDQMGDLTAIANEYGLKSPLTLLLWKYQRDEQLQAQMTKIRAGSGGRKSVFVQEQELLEWILSQRAEAITKQDILNHIMAAYPEFAATKSVGALKIWVVRFLKRHISSTPSKDAAAKAASDSDQSHPESGVVSTAAEVQLQQHAEPAASAPTAVPAVSTAMPVATEAPATTSVTPAFPAAAPATTARPIAGPPASLPPPTPRKREKRGCPDGYVLHSNEFKLNALKKLDEGKSISEVAEELGLKSHNTLAYWNSIRDKLAVADKKRYRLAGGGRRSSCTFEDELLTWVTERHQKGEATDVKAVLDYMREFHPSFTEGKKEPTLRKWILRFFKRCWRSSSVADGSKDMDKSCIFV